MYIRMHVMYRYIICINMTYNLCSSIEFIQRRLEGVIHDFSIFK